MFHNGFMGGMWLGWLFWLVILIVIIWFVFNQMNKNKQDTQSKGQETALDIIKKRYAKGDLTKEQFEQMKKDLS